MKSKYTKVFTKEPESVLFDAYARWVTEGKKFKKTILFLEIRDESGKAVARNYHRTNQYCSWATAKRFLNTWATEVIINFEKKAENV